MGSLAHPSQPFPLPAKPGSSYPAHSRRLRRQKPCPSTPACLLLILVTEVGRDNEDTPARDTPQSTREERGRMGLTTQRADGHSRTEGEARQ